MSFRFYEALFQADPGVANGFCLFNNNLVTNSTVRSRARCGVQCTDVNQHRLEVRRFTTSVLTNADADRILADATTVLQVNDGAGDVACRSALIRAVGVNVSPQGDGSIDSGAEFATFNGLRGNVKVVNAINFCEALIPNVIGCAARARKLASRDSLYPKPGRHTLASRVRTQ